MMLSWRDWITCEQPVCARRRDFPVNEDRFKVCAAGCAEFFQPSPSVCVFFRFAGERDVARHQDCVGSRADLLALGRGVPHELVAQTGVRVHGRLDLSLFEVDIGKMQKQHLRTPT
ncbi:hypothetical protein AJ87_14945 [Rhizobium yanglingense]|nr:hypothetical protein AJ87_14945 [Rhizobium yanglingense]